LLWVSSLFSPEHTVWFYCLEFFWAHPTTWKYSCSVAGIVLNFLAFLDLPCRAVLFCVQLFAHYYIRFHDRVNDFNCWGSMVFDVQFSVVWFWKVKICVFIFRGLCLLMFPFCSIRSIFWCCCSPNILVALSFSLHSSVLCVCTFLAVRVVSMVIGHLLATLFPIVVLRSFSWFWTPPPPTCVL
jgi:hypothetical protein